MCLASALYCFENVNRVPAPRWFRGRCLRKRWKEWVQKEMHGYIKGSIPSKQMMCLAGLRGGPMKSITIFTYFSLEAPRLRNRRPRDPTERRRIHRLRSTYYDKKSNYITVQLTRVGLDGWTGSGAVHDGLSEPPTAAGVGGGENKFNSHLAIRIERLIRRDLKFPQFRRRDRPVF